MYAARAAGVPTVPYRLPAVTQEDGKMEGRDRVGGREGGRTERVVMTKEQPAPRPPSSPSPFSFVPLIATGITQNMAARVTSGRENTK